MQIKPPSRAISSFVHLTQEEERSVLFIAENEKNNRDVQAYAAYLRCAGVTFTVQLVSLTELAAEKDKGESLPAISLSQQQQRVLDYFKQAMELGSSDIHMTIDSKITRIEMRIHGDLELKDEISREQGMSLASTICMSMCDVAEKQFFENQVQAGRVKEEFLTRVGLFGARYSHQPCVGGLEVVMRVIPHESGEPPTLESLGFLPEQIAVIYLIFKRPEGIIINSGPTGAGKSTTLRVFCNILIALFKGTKRLTTVEDPPEGKIDGAIQCPIICDKSDPEEVKRAWVVAISTTRRQDPDMLMIGEIQNLDSAMAAISAASTGHRVVTTTHANDALSIPERLIIEGVEPERVMDAEMMIGLLSQRLVKVSCPHCSEDWQTRKPHLSATQIAHLTRHCEVEKVRFIKTDGCEHCHRGVVGRVVIAEVIHPDARFMQLLRHEGKTAARSYWRKNLNGITRVEHMVRHINTGRVDPLVAEDICPLNENDWLLLPDTISAPMNVSVVKPADIPDKAPVASITETGPEKATEEDDDWSLPVTEEVKS
ncbi:GspE/PulE family protein [Citrobacter koseri]|uniref:GspE/PulE family protein n=1 Tax=Citrobacter koseri TaxID=545 RepID=UPI001F3D8ADA|nr:ATPase, T2SS/T4P/T4SS family [Citrobacter koseri]